MVDSDRVVETCETGASSMAVSTRRINIVPSSRPYILSKVDVKEGSS